MGLKFVNGQAYPLGQSVQDVSPAKLYWPDEQIEVAEELQLYPPGQILHKASP